MSSHPDLFKDIDSMEPDAFARHLSDDVRFTFGLYTYSIVGFKDRSSLARIDSVTARDSVTAVYWFKNRYAEQFYDAATRLLIVPEHLLEREPRATLLTSAFGRQPIGSGRFRLGKWTPNASIELVADTANYHGRPSLDRVVFAVTTDPKRGFGNVATVDNEG